MHPSLEETLLAIAARVPSSLIATRHVARLRALAQLVRIEGRAVLGFACPLGMPAPEAHAMLYAPLHSHEAGDTNGVDPFPESARDEPAWQRIRAAYAGLSSPSTKSAAYLLVQCAGDTMPLAVPALCVVVCPVYAPDATQQGRRPNSNAWLKETMPPLLTGAMLPARIRDLLSECLAVLPDGVRVLQIGILLGRARPLVRLRVLGTDAHALVDYLGVVGWPGHRGDHSNTYTRLTPFAPFFVLHLDLGDAIESRIGLEFPYPLHAVAGGSENRRSILEYLVQAGLCIPDKRDALLNWPSPACICGGQPHYLLDDADPPGAMATRAPVRSLARIQIDYRPGRPLEAVAYLAAGHCRHPANPVR